MTDITELAQRMSIERIKQIALGGTPTMGERESLAITALHFAEELKIATDAFQAAGLAQLAAEEALEKAQTKAIEQGRTACELFDEVTALRQRIAELESRTVTVKQGEVLVTVAGFTGCGKSAIAGEIEIAMKAIGVPVTWANGDSEKRMTGADWLTAIEMYKPTVRIVEENIPRVAGIQAIEGDAS
ncbi:TPA: ead/Ea22-like family protein [Klebsiella pneumoniae]